MIFYALCQAEEKEALASLRKDLEAQHAAARRQRNETETLAEKVRLLRVQPHKSMQQARKRVPAQV